MTDEVSKLKQENAVLRMRAHAAETALYAIEETIRLNLLTNFIQPIVRQAHDLNKRFPIDGSSDEAGVKKIALDAVRASNPALQSLGDDEVLKLVFGNGTENNTTNRTTKG